MKRWLRRYIDAREVVVLVGLVAVAVGLGLIDVRLPPIVVGAFLVYLGVWHRPPGDRT